MEISTHGSRAVALRDARWRALLHKTITAYTAPDFDPRSRLNAREVARREGLALPDEIGIVKVERYALAAAAILDITNRLVYGHGSEARLDPRWLSRAPTPNEGGWSDKLTNTLRQAHLSAAADAENDKNSHVSYFLTEFDELGVRYDHATADLIRSGNTMPHELQHFTRVTPAAISRTPETAHLDNDGRVLVAHKMLHIITGRASRHLDRVVDGRPWWVVERTKPVVRATQPRRNAEAHSMTEISPPIAYDLVGPNGEDLFPVAMQVVNSMEPLLKCPAHQRIYGTESALQRQLHAGTSLAASQGLYHPAAILL